MIKQVGIVQHNVNRQKIASLQLRDYCDKNGADVLIQEPVMSQDKRVYGFKYCKQVSGGKEAGAAVIVMNNELNVIELTDLTTQHVVTVKIYSSDAAEAVTVVSAYFKYNMPTPCFIEKLRLILDREPCTIIGADVNGHSPMWHCPDRNNRGLYTEELIEDYDLTIANRQNCIRTYNREGMGSSNIDVTLLTPQVRDKIGGWSVHDNTDSDHNTISFILSLRDGGTGCPTAYRFNACRANWEGFTRCLHRLKPTIDSSSIETQACTITGVIQTAAVECIPQIKRKSSRVGEPPWWTPELTSLRKDISRKRRMGLHRHDRVTYNGLRNQYLSSIRQAKAAAWREFAGDINGNKWGKAFRYAKRGSVTRRAPSTMQRPDGIYTETLAETADLLLGSFFPSEDHDRAYQIEGLLTPYERPVDTERVRTAIWRMKPRKAPGADGITAGILRKAWPVLAQEITRLFRECMVKATFPQVWKNAKLVVIPKPGKADMANPKAYRPVSLLPTLAKALETLIIRDLETETKLNEHTPQHGFVPGRSTSTAMRAVHDWVDASTSRHVFGVFLDITGAFDNVAWFPLLSRLKALGASVRTLTMVMSYLKDRTVSLTLEKESYSRSIERGCPQGSQLGPTLWKVAMTGIDEIRLDSTATIVMYADDIALLVGAARPQTAFKRIEGYLESLRGAFLGQGI